MELKNGDTKDILNVFEKSVIVFDIKERLKRILNDILNYNDINKIISECKELIAFESNTEIIFKKGVLFQTNNIDNYPLLYYNKINKKFDIIFKTEKKRELYGIDDLTDNLSDYIFRILDYSFFNNYLKIKSFINNKEFENKYFTKNILGLTYQYSKIISMCLTNDLKIVIDFITYKLALDKNYFATPKILVQRRETYNIFDEKVFDLIERNDRKINILDKTEMIDLFNKENYKVYKSTIKLYKQKIKDLYKEYNNIELKYNEL